MALLIDLFQVEEILHSLGLWPHFPWMLLEVLHPLENYTPWCDLGNKWACIVLSGKSRLNQIRARWSCCLIEIIWIQFICLPSTCTHYFQSQLMSTSLLDPFSVYSSPSHNPFTISISGLFCLTTSLLPAPMCIGLKKCWWLNILCMPCKFMCDKPIRDCRQETW